MQKMDVFVTVVYEGIEDDDVCTAQEKAEKAVETALKKAEKESIVIDAKGKEHLPAKVISEKCRTST